MRRFLIVLLAVVATSLSLAAAGQARDPLKVTLTLNGDPATGVTFLVVLNGEKHAEFGPDLKAVAAKFAMGTVIDVYRRICDTGKIEVIVAPTGEPLGVEDKDCQKRKEPPPGTTCRCGWIGAFNLGEFVTIDADTGRVKSTSK